jgi:hypothetical protein
MIPAVSADREGSGMLTENAGEISITTVFDDYAADAALETRWGFAAVIATPSATVLFDTGSDGTT